MAIRIVDVIDDPTFALLPPCADPGFDHRSCDYWEDADRGSKAARASWFGPQAAPEPPKPSRPRNPFGGDDDDEPAFNPFAPARRETYNPFLAADDDAPENPFAPKPKAGPVGGRRRPAEAPAAGPRAGGLRLVREGAARGRRARGVRPVRAAVRVPAGPPDPGPVPAPAVRTAARGDHVHRHDRRGARPRAGRDAGRGGLRRPGRARVRRRRDLSAGRREARRDERRDPAFWQGLGFAVAAPDERFPVMRRELA